MRQIKILTYILDLGPLNKYLEAIIQCPGPKILNEKVEVLFDFFILQNRTSTFSFNIKGS